MYTPAELIEALHRRLRRSIRPMPRREGVPPSWQAWLDAVGGNAGPVTDDRTRTVMESLGGPPLRPAAETIGGWKAFRALWRQQWEPPARDERWLRVSSRTMSILLHLLFLVVLSLLMHARFLVAPAPDAQRGEHVIEVEYIGSGTPDEDGGRAPPEPVVVEAGPLPEDEPAPVATSPAEPRPVPPAVAETGPPPELPESPAQPEEQPLVVTETPLPDGRFQVPPVRPVEIAPARVREAEVAPRTREIELAQTRELEIPDIAPVDARVPELAPPPMEVVEREVALPPRPLAAPEVQVPAMAIPELQPRTQQARVRDIPMPPAAESAARAGEAMANEATARAGDEAAVSASAPAPQDAGPGQVQRESGWTTPQRGDDWGAAARDRPGGQGGTSSLFNPDGSVRMPGGGRVGGGLPPGTITEDYEKIDRMGTWLRRPPTDYEPTSFDRFWVPHESLLQEWVRRSVRTVLIPIPGTGKSIRCNIATLAFSGGCDLVDPNLQDDPAGTRPPPDVPFRPELHEDQEGLSDDAWD